MANDTLCDHHSDCFDNILFYCISSGYTGWLIIPCEDDLSLLGVLMEKLKAMSIFSGGSNRLLECFVRRLFDCDSNFLRHDKFIVGFAHNFLKEVVMCVPPE